MTDDLYPCDCSAPDCTGLARWQHAAPEQHLTVDGVVLRDVPIRELVAREKRNQT